jgi:hypothetical protein
MSTDGTTNQNAPTRREFAERLRQETLGVRLDKSQFGLSRTVTDEQRERMADLFNAEGESVRASKRLLNKRNEAYQRVTGLLNRARQIWKESTVPYPEPGLRLIRREGIEGFDNRMQAVRAELTEAVAALDSVYRDQLLPEAMTTLGQLFDSADYPASLADEFGLEWGYRGIDPPEYLRQVSPKLFEQEQERIRARFEEAVALAEQAFTDEFARMVEHMVERLTPGPDGKSKTFRDTAITNLKEFFARFQSLDVGSNADLQAMVAEAQRAVDGVDVAKLRKDVIARDQIRGAMQGLSQRLESLMVDRPKRRIRLADEPAQQAEGTEAA